MDEANEQVLGEVPHASDYRFHPLLTIEELQHGEIDFPALVRKAERQLDAFDGSVDAIVGYWDFPVSTLVPILSERYGLRSTSLASVVKCEHKYWSRLEQAEVTDALPRFGLVDLDADAPEPPEGVRFPMWLKPVTAYSSELAFGVADLAEFRAAVARIREGAGRVGRPFDFVLDRLPLPPAAAAAGGRGCLAEEAIRGDQVAVEGYVHEGRVTVYGTLDSLTYPDSPCFLRHQYPSQLPDGVTERLRDISERVITRIGLNNATFSIEFFYDPATDRINLLEVNPRHSQSHAELFAYVDGVPNHHVMLSLALGRDPALPHRAGDYALAAKWYYRRFGDAVVRRSPTEEELAALAGRIPGTHVNHVVPAGARLSELPEQDSYSFELAHVFTAADSEEELVARYDEVVKGLPFAFEEMSG
ncbi:ATP-grasp domain-containing protein [Streptomyces johnsoniae]|uniref:ATP-grasp domain-containing protein n=1 Tax=Streptomyces johnsoniae TaxID=3075532 RepID=A0ABU2RZK6_9ACTN|nr:ATP-grasp domain-containing protein [Streptomyces sp. DSM 41886]MDT0441230.1 ATP-grasp domain-containing protein [Streptomyces sp. DSM 41886]